VNAGERESVCKKEGEKKGSKRGSVQGLSPGYRRQNVFFKKKSAPEGLQPMRRGVDSSLRRSSTKQAKQDAAVLNSERGLKKN
jgi:hypothetical protein